MKGKILVSILALGASSIVLANGGHIATAPMAVAAAPNYFDGFVVGLDGSMQHLNGNAQDSVGYQIDGYRQPQSMQANVAPIYMQSLYSDTSSLNTDIGDNTLGGGIFAGYGKVFNTNYYLGGEVYARYAHDTINVNTYGNINFVGVVDGQEHTAITGNQSTSVNIDSDWSYGAAIKLGYLLTPKTMVYLLAGVEYSKFEIDVNHSLSGMNLGEKFNISDWSSNYSFDRNKLAFVPGVGIETMLTDKLSLKAEYTYADFGQFSHSNNSTSPELSLLPADGYAVANNSSEDKVSLKRGLFSLGLAYHFNGI